MMRGTAMPVKPEQAYLDFLRCGRFMLQRSRHSGRFFFHPRVVEPGTGETDLEWVLASGSGTVYSTSVVRQKPPITDYNIALIDLDEGPRMMARVEGLAPDDVTIGLRVSVRIIEEAGTPLVVFDPVS